MVTREGVKHMYGNLKSRYPKLPDNVYNDIPYRRNELAMTNAMQSHSTEYVSNFI